MTKKEYMLLCEAQWKDIDKVSNNNTLYDLEKDFVEVWQKLGREVLEKSVGELPTNHRKKKSK